AAARVLEESDEARVEGRRIGRAPLALLELGEGPALEAGDEDFQEVIAPVDLFRIVRKEIAVPLRQRALERDRVVGAERRLRAVYEGKEQLHDLRGVLELLLGRLRLAHDALERGLDPGTARRRRQLLEEAADPARELGEARDPDRPVDSQRDRDPARVL